MAAPTQIAHYKITGKLGEGGMGAVYRATDTKLNREVAIKILPDAIDADRVARFEREARIVASLHHPNICVIHDIGPNYMVMELIEGETLAARIGKGAIPLEQSIGYAVQISDALDRAHRAGVIHRDVKPHNIMLTRDGVKVLDFGLAKPVPAAPGPTESTLTKALTTEGVIVGTPQYMAPERFEGSDADVRSDIWAFGAVLYEMVTGRKAFEGKNYTSVAAAILGADPPPMAMTPAWLDRLIRRCLQKDPERRYLAMHDIVLDLLSPPAESNPAPARSSRLPWAAAALCAAGLAAVSVVHFRERASQPRPMHFEISVPEGTALEWYHHPVVSPDGKSIVYGTTAGGVSGSHWVRPMGELAAKRLARSGWEHCWSSDSKTITALLDDNTVGRLEISGGEPRVLANGRGLFGPLGPFGIACSPRGILVGSSQGPLIHVPANGGEAKPFTKLGADESGHQFPHFLPDGSRFLFSVIGGDNWGLFAGSLDSPEVTRILGASGPAVYASNGYLLYQLGQALMAHRFDPRTLTLSGEPVRILDLPVTERMQLYAWFSANPEILAYRTPAPESRHELVWYERTGRRLSTLGQSATYSNPALSPDGRRLAISRGRLGARDLWTFDLARGTDARLTFDAADEMNPVWSPAGDEIYFSSEKRGGRRIYRIPASGVGKERPVDEEGTQNSVDSISPDGKTLLFNDGDATMMVPSNGGKTEPVLSGPGRGGRQSAISPDGRYFAYSSGQSGVVEVYVENFPPQGDKWKISVGGGSEPVWRGDGKELYYMRDKTVMAVPIAYSGDVLQPGTPVALFDAPLTRQALRNRYVVTRDGSRFLLITEPKTAGETKFHVVVNWAAGLPK